MSEGDRFIGMTLGQLQETQLSANDRQIGGSHYQKGQLQHWDVVEKHAVPYLEGVASKYPLRWREKGGVQDLKKTAHYVEKILESAKSHPRWMRLDRLGDELVMDSIDLCDLHGVVETPLRVMVLLLLQGFTPGALGLALTEFRKFVDSIDRTGPGTPESGERPPETDARTGDAHYHILLPEGSQGELIVVGGSLRLKYGRFE